MREVLLVRFGEVHLKGLNRPFFLKKLTDNIKKAIAPIGGHVWLSDSRIYVSGCEDMADCAGRVRKVFGIHSVSPAVEIEKDFEAIKVQALRMTASLSGSFKVFARRSDKRFPLDSMAIERELGHAILEANPALRVDIRRPEHEVNVEIRDFAYLYVEKLPAVGGLPMGTGGKALLLLSGGIDSPVAGFALMKRGVTVDAVHFMSPPYTSERAKEKVIELGRILAAYGGGVRIHMVPFTEIQLQIHEKCPEEFGTLLMRRYMMRIAERIAKNHRARALITGESLGQVASQTMESLCATDAVVDMPVFRPLIGFDKLEITEKAVEIGTYQTSILPYEDCCTVFTPRHPSTKPKLEALAAAETLLDGDALMERALANIEEVLV